VEAISLGRLDKIELIVNGESFETFKGTDPHRIAATTKVPVPLSSWIAAKVVGPEDAHLASALEGRPLGGGQIAHTSPVYVIDAGEPIRAARTSDAEYFIKWCDAAAQAWKSHIATTAADTQSDSTVTQRIAQAKRVFEDLQTSLDSRTKR
jgi:hypothetical protein